MKRGQNRTACLSSRREAKSRTSHNDVRLRADVADCTSTPASRSRPACAASPSVFDNTSAPPFAPRSRPTGATSPPVVDCTSAPASRSRHGECEGRVRRGREGDGLGYLRLARLRRRSRSRRPSCPSVELPFGRAQTKVSIHAARGAIFFARPDWCAAANP